MKNALLLIAIFLILLTTACGEKQEEYDACFCAPIIENNSNSDAPVLGFYETYKSTELGGFINDVIMDSIHFQLDSTYIDVNDFEHSSEFLKKFRVNVDADNRYVESPKLGFALAKDTSRINEILSFHTQENWIEVDKVKYAWSKNSTNFLDEAGEYFTLYALKLNAENKPRFSSKGVESALNFIDSRDNQASVSVSMTEEGTKRWAQMTTENIGHYISMVSRNKVLSSPVINGPITGGETLISAGFSEKEAKELADLINCEAHKRKVGQAAFKKEMADCSKKK